MKKFISLTLALVMVLSVLSVMTVSVSAAETYTSAGKTLINYDFTIEGDEENPEEGSFNHFKQKMTVASSGGATKDGSLEYDSVKGKLKVKLIAASKNNRINMPQITLRKGYVYTVSYDLETSANARISCQFGTTLTKDTNVDVVPKADAQQTKHISLTFKYIGNEDIKNGFYLLFSTGSNGKQTTDEWYTIDNINITEYDPTVGVTLFKYDFNSDVTYDKTTMIKSSAAKGDLTWMDLGNGNGALVNTINTDATSGTSQVNTANVTFKDGYKYTFKVKYKTSGGGAFMTGANANIPNVEGKCNYMNASARMQSPDDFALYTKSFTYNKESCTGSHTSHTNPTNFNLICRAPSGNDITKGMAVIIDEITLVEEPPVPTITLSDGVLTTGDKGVYNGKATAVVYGTVSEVIDLFGNKTYGMEIWADGNDAQKIALPMMDSEGNEAVLSGVANFTDRKFAIRVFGDAISLDNTYIFKPYISGIADAGAEISVSAE